MTQEQLEQLSALLEFASKDEYFNTVVGDIKHVQLVCDDYAGQKYEEETSAMLAQLRVDDDLDSNVNPNTGSDLEI